MKKAIIILLAVFCTLEGFSQNAFKPLENTETLKKGVKMMAEKTSSLTTSFNQEKHLSILTKPLKSAGKMYFKKPDLLKWAYVSPYNYAIIFKAERIIINDEGKVSNFDLSSSKSFMEINQIMMNSVSGNILQEDQFDIDYLSSPEQYLAKMKPKSEQMKSYITSIEVFIDKVDFTVSKIKLNEKNGDFTEIDFYDKKLNAKVSDAVFQAQ